LVCSQVAFADFIPEDVVSIGMAPVIDDDRPGAGSITGVACISRLVAAENRTDLFGDPGETLGVWP
jgi:hypothetical protein